MYQEKYNVKFILQLKYIHPCTASACLRKILFNHLSVKWALISYPKPLCFILLLPLSIFLVCGSVLCKCAHAHMCTQHTNTDMDTCRSPVRSIILVHEHLCTMCDFTIQANFIRSGRQCVCVWLGQVCSSLPCESTQNTPHMCQPLPSQLTHTPLVQHIH